MSSLWLVCEGVEVKCEWNGRISALALVKATESALEMWEAITGMHRRIVPDDAITYTVEPKSTKEDS